MSIPVLLNVDTILALGSRVGEIKPIKGNVVYGAALNTVTHAK